MFCFMYCIRTVYRLLCAEICEVVLYVALSFCLCYLLFMSPTMFLALIIVHHINRHCAISHASVLHHLLMFV